MVGAQRDNGRDGKEMDGIERCGVCGIPLFIGEQLSWENNGVIALRASPFNRMVAMETGVIDGLFAELAGMLESPVEDMVVESRRRETRRFIERTFAFEVRNLLLYPDGREQLEGRTTFEKMLERSLVRMAKDLTLRVMEVAQIFGYGKFKLGERWESGQKYPWRMAYIRDPYSVLMWAADVLGTVEAFEGRDMRVTWREISPRFYRVEVVPGEHPVELEEKLGRRRYPFKPGSLEWETCPECGVPVALSSFRWDLGEGFITEVRRGRRVALVGPLALEAVFRELEYSHGAAVSEKVVEAQRRYAKSVATRDDALVSGEEFRKDLALRGFGNLVEYRADGAGVDLRMENACLPLLVAGTAQALFELAAGVDETLCRWEVFDDGDLVLEIRPA